MRQSVSGSTGAWDSRSRRPPDATWTIAPSRATTARYPGRRPASKPSSAGSASGARAASRVVIAGIMARRAARRPTSRSPNGTTSGGQPQLARKVLASKRCISSGCARLLTPCRDPHGAEWLNAARALRPYLPAFACAGLLFTAGPAMAGDIQTAPGLPDLDVRTGTVAPTAAQRADAKALRAEVAWNQFGTPSSLARRGGALGATVGGATAPDAARAWLDR